MQGVRVARSWALAIVVLMAAGCAATPPAPPSAAPSGPAAAAPLRAPSAAVPAAAAPLGASAASAAATPPAAASAPMASASAATPPHYDNIWQRIRAGFAIPDMDGPQMQPYVQQAVHWYTTRPDYVARMTERSRKYLYYIVQEVQRRGMPTELALLPFIESAFNPDALSRASAAGMWQFMPSTGEHFNLHQTMFQDGRRDVMASTRAALDYLGKLHAMFGDWKLALAAYNWGEGGLQHAIAHNLARGLPVDYAHLQMPAETRNYYPKLQAVKDIIEHPRRYGITLPDVPNHPYFTPVPITQDMDVAQAARLAGISVADFRSLNPAFKKPLILAATHPQILLPYDNATQFEQALAAHHGPLARWTAYRVRRTSTPQALAQRLHVAAATLRDVNGIPARILIKAGSTVLVPRPPQDNANVSKRVAEHAVLALAPDRPPLRRLRLFAGRHDTPRSVARRYGVSVAEVARWNHVRVNAHFRPRATLVVYTREVPRHVPDRRFVQRRPAPGLRLAELRREHEQALHLAELRREHEQALHLAELRRAHEHALHLAELRRAHEHALHLAELRRAHERALRVAQRRRAVHHSTRVARRSTPSQLIRVAER